VSDDPSQERPAGPESTPTAPGEPDPARRARALVDDWVTTVFRPFASAADLDRLIESVSAALGQATAAADARVAALAADVDRAAREVHAAHHQGLFEACGEAPCPALRGALAPLLPAVPPGEGGSGPGLPQPS
jgi:hypothetical protein